MLPEFKAPPSPPGAIVVHGIERVFKVRKGKKVRAKKKRTQREKFIMGISGGVKNNERKMLG